PVPSDLRQMVHRTRPRPQRLHGVLREVADAQVRVPLALAGQQRQLADQGFDEGGLAGAVGAEEGDAVAGLEGEGEVLEDGDRIPPSRLPFPLSRLREKGVTTI